MSTMLTRAEAELATARRRLEKLRQRTSPERALARLAVASPSHPLRWAARVLPGVAPFLTGVAFGWVVLPWVTVRCAEMVAAVDPTGVGLPILLGLALLAMLGGAIARRLAVRLGRHCKPLPDEAAAYEALELAVWRAQRRVDTLKGARTAA